MKKVLVLLSGGIDSTICLALAVKKYGNKNVKTLCINYGQKNDREIKSARLVAKHYDVSFDIINLENIFSSHNCSLLKKSNKKIPIICYDKQYKELKDKEFVSTNVPFRNGVFLSVCTAYAISNNIELIYYGIHREEGIAYYLYPDCSEKFHKNMRSAIKSGTNNIIDICSPLLTIQKKEIIKLGIKNNIPFEKTWTCYEDGDIPCGKCCACVDRLKGFKENNLEDPLIYRSYL